MDRAFSDLRFLSHARARVLHTLAAFPYRRTNAALRSPLLTPQPAGSTRNARAYHDVLNIAVLVLRAAVAAHCRLPPILRLRLYVAGRLPPGFATLRLGSRALPRGHRRTCLQHGIRVRTYRGLRTICSASAAWRSRFVAACVFCISDNARSTAFVWTYRRVLPVSALFRMLGWADIPALPSATSRARRGQW